MKKTTWIKVCYFCSVLLVLGFIIHTVTDYIRYNSTLNSAPFYIWVIVNAFCFLLPAVIFWVAAVVIRKKANKD